MSQFHASISTSLRSVEVDSMKKTKLRAIGVALVAAVTILCAAPAARAQVFIETQVAEPMMVPGLGMRGQGKTGTGKISGRVLSTETGAPLRRAQVRLTAPEVGVKTALTDTDGRFEFKDLPAGRFTVNASKSGHVSVQFGQSRPFESGRPIELADKQVLDKADIFMPRGGVISGRIVDEFGEPVTDAMVSTMRQTWLNARRRIQTTGRIAQTNDLGQFRLYGLPPGEYYVSATLRNAEVMVMDMALAGPAPAAGSQPTSGYAPTYFPGTTTPTNAQRVTVTVGHEAQNTDFALAPVRLARISGSVTSSEGKPVEGAMISAAPLNRTAEVGLAMMGMTGRTTKDGTFTISSVAPGDYTLNVTSMRFITSGDGDTMMFRAAIGGGGDGGNSETASLPISVAGEDLTNVLIMTSKGGTATGRLAFEGGAKPPATAGVRITATEADMDGPMGGGSSIAAKEDGSFELKGLSGRRVIRAANLPAGWIVKAVRVNGDDVTDTGVEFKSGQEVTGVEIVATNKSTEVGGTVSGSNGAAVKEYTIVVFSEDAQQWSLPMTRWVTGSRPDQEGRFRVRNLPPGGYYAVALDYVEQGSWGDPELLERLKAHAKRFTLREGGTETLDLKLVDQF
jgi:5-hydroxyisourate hydrolase-like protein (transthyretin family)